MFLMDALEELGFLTCECPEVHGLRGILDKWFPDLIVVGASLGGTVAGETLKALAAARFDGKVLLIGSDRSLELGALRDLSEKLAIAMLPTLSTPFASEGLRKSLSLLLPVESVQPPHIDFTEALDAGWLELWYQPKINAEALRVSGAEALIRLRHPTWGIVSPARFLPDKNDPRCRALSQYLILQAIADWRSFAIEYGHVEIAINLPISFLSNQECLTFLYNQLPNDTTFEGLIVEIDASDIIHDLDMARRIARQLRFHKIGVSIDDTGAEWPSLLGMDDFPFVELKIDREFVAGSADDRLRRYVCQRILDLADGYGARTVAEGVETAADFQCVRSMGVDLVQGFLFAKPMSSKKFARNLRVAPLGRWDSPGSDGSNGVAKSR
jgi:EAL domain-containing protein (putative c-di-GMP-specific phosphodiesterase class I)